MNTRSFLKTSLLALTAVVVAPFALKPDKLKDLSIRHFYKLDANGCNPRRVRLYELRKGDLFIWEEPEDKFVSKIEQVEEDPRLVPAPKGYRDPLTGDHTWGIICKRADLARPTFSLTNALV